MEFYKISFDKMEFYILSFGKMDFYNTYISLARWTSTIHTSVWQDGI
jgi:hypothetical protein